MDVQIQSSTIIPQPNPNGKLEPVDIPLTVFDRFASNIYIAVMFAFTPPTPPNSSIIDGLARVLVNFPTLVGRLGYCSQSKRPCILLGGPGRGAVVVEAEVASRLEDHLPLEPRPEFELLRPRVDGQQGPPALLQVQLNRFQCGGLIVGVTAHHRVADGRSMSTFYVAWGQAVRGLPIDPLPVYDQSWLNPRTPPRCEFEHWGFEFVPTSPLHDFAFPPSSVVADPDRISNVLLNYSSEFINTKLKAHVHNERYTTFEILLAHIWRKITIARGLGPDVRTMIRVSVNGRPRLRPPVPSEFFGNLVLNAYPNTNVKEVIGGGLVGPARTIREAIRKIGDSYIRSFIDFGAMYKDEDLVPVYDKDTNVLSPNLEVDSWLGFRFGELDFGGGGALCAFMPTWVPIDGLIVFLPSLRKGGGVDVFVGLLEEHAKVLRQMSHSLD